MEASKSPALDGRAPGEKIYMLVSFLAFVSVVPRLIAHYSSYKDVLISATESTTTQTSSISALATSKRH